MDLWGDFWTACNIVAYSAMIQIYWEKTQKRHRSMIHRGAGRLAFAT
jgi:hypothetical protein